jgi:hypothetical protein
MSEPTQRFRIGFVTASVWENSTNGRAFYNVTLQRTYKEDGEYKQTDSLGHGDLLNSAKALERAEAWISAQ